MKRKNFNRIRIQDRMMQQINSYSNETFIRLSVLSKFLLDRNILSKKEKKKEERHHVQK